MLAPNHHDIRSQRAIRTYLINLFVLTVLMTLIAASASADSLDSAASELPNNPSIWLDGPIQAVPGAEISYDIISNATNLYGAQFDLNFDPAVLQVVGAEFTPGSCPVPGLVIDNVDNGAGSASFAVTALNPSAPCDGGIVASIKFQVLPAAALGSTQLHFNKVILSDPDGLEIPVTAVDLNLEVVQAGQYRLNLPVILG